MALLFLGIAVFFISTSIYHNLSNIPRNTMRCGDPAMSQLELTFVRIELAWKNPSADWLFGNRFHGFRFCLALGLFGKNAWSIEEVFELELLKYVKYRMWRRLVLACNKFSFVFPEE
mmetsp:Transcript_28874/g.70402  ORF Transcript_28874/g.70402 Transcript_28874/m.70402 type:complete len:117 (+) Transcript_28874:64-414(+)